MSARASDQPFSLAEFLLRLNCHLLGPALGFMAEISFSTNFLAFRAVSVGFYNPVPRCRTIERSIIEPPDCRADASGVGKFGRLLNPLLRPSESFLAEYLRKSWFRVRLTAGPTFQPTGMLVVAQYSTLDDRVHPVLSFWSRTEKTLMVGSYTGSAAPSLVFYHGPPAVADLGQWILPEKAAAGAIGSMSDLQARIEARSLAMSRPSSEFRALPGCSIIGQVVEEGRSGRSYGFMAETAQPQPEKVAKLEFASYCPK